MFLIRSCAGCGVEAPRRRRPFCARCTTTMPPVGRIDGLVGLDGAGALYHYGGPVRRAVVVAKRGGRPDFFRRVAPQLAVLARTVTNRSLPENGSTDSPSTGSGWQPDLVTWIPASSRGRSERGYDQGRLMAGVVGRRLGLPVRRVLAGGRSSQIGRGRAERLASDGYRARGAVGGRVLLIDDVITTGASMVSGAAAIRAAGATSVVGVAVAWAASAEEVAAHRPLAPAPSGTVRPSATSDPWLEFGLRSNNCQPNRE